MTIREIEDVIDVEHKKSPVFTEDKEQTIYDLLASFEDACSCILMGSVLNPFALKKITEQMDALSVALLWADQLCNDDAKPLKKDITEMRYEQCTELLNDYAYPYSVICSGYISYSRKRFDAELNENIVTFKPCENQNSSMWNDIIRESSEMDLNLINKVINPYKLIGIINELKEQVRVEDEMLCYSLSERILSIFSEIAEQQWNLSKTLPEDWKFEKFTMEEYKHFWVTITTLCYIHFCSCFTVSDPLIRLKNSTIIQNLECIIEYVESRTELSKEKIEAIIDYITYDAKKKNVDIMYQPIVRLADKTLIITPVLFMGSKPERNLLSVISSMRDREYFKEVNDLEELMVSELESKVSASYIVKHKHLREDLPDIDFAIYDDITNSALICETKWFAAADSTKEVFAKEDEITHGCEQVEKIMGYAMSDRAHFIKQVFNVDEGEMVDLFGCVVAKHNIRTQHKYVPVIDLKRIEELFVQYSLNTVFHMIRNHEYEIPLPKDATITYQSVQYADFEFRIPALCFGETQDTF